jgi:dihydropteroate synthase
VEDDRGAKGELAGERLAIGGRDFPLEAGPYVLGVLNLSPESENADSVVPDVPAAIARARSLSSAGAHIIDVGGRSTHFAATPVSCRVERDRVVPAVEGLKAEGFLVSIDSWDARTVRAALAAGADLVNDSGGFRSAAMIAAVAEGERPVIIPCLRGRSPPRSRAPGGSDPVATIARLLARAVARAEAAGVRDAILDPGIGYAHWDLVDDERRERLQRRVFSELGRLASLGRPLLAPVHRKRRRATTLELIRLAHRGGATFFRTHEPRLVYEALGLRAEQARS